MPPLVAAVFKVPGYWQLTAAPIEADFRSGEGGVRT